MKTFRIACVLAALAVGGCAHYQTPGSGVSIPEITSPAIADVMARKPAATWPAKIIAVRVQGPGYQSYTNRGYGQGGFSVVTTRDIETEAEFQRLAAMPKVAGFGLLNRLLLPVKLESAEDLRKGAAQLQADIVLMYTLDTSFRTETNQIGPLQLVGLGFFPTKKAIVTSTCSVALIDTRTGYVYGVAEWSANEDQRSGVWNKRDAIDKARMRAERSAFVGAVGEVEKLWAGLSVAQPGGSAPIAVTP
jgi:hypothetical protein